MIEAHIYPHVPATLYRPRVKFSLQYSLNGLGSIHLQFFFSTDEAVGIGESVLYLFRGDSATNPQNVSPKLLCQ